MRIRLTLVEPDLVLDVSNILLFPRSNGGFYSPYGVWEHRNIPLITSLVSLLVTSIRVHDICYSLEIYEIALNGRESTDVSGIR